MSWLLLPSSVSLLSGFRVQTPIPVSSMCQVRSEKAKKEKVSTLITATTSVPLPKVVSTGLTINLDLVLTNPIGKVGV